MCYIFRKISKSNSRVFYDMKEKASQKWKRKLPKKKLGVNIKVLLLLYLTKMIITVTFTRFQEWNASCQPKSWLSPPASRPSISRQLLAPSTTSGPKLIEALGMPHRGAFNLGFSATTFVSLASKIEGAEMIFLISSRRSKPIKSSFFSKSDKPKFKSKEELAVERKQRLNKKPDLDKPDTAQAGKMNCSVPKNRKLLLEMKAAESMGPPKRRDEQGNGTGWRLLWGRC